LPYSPDVFIEDIGNRICIPARSRLFGLEPIGIGSAGSEGLISYLIRLSKEHCISPRLLLSTEFLPRMSEVNSGRHAMFYMDYAKTLHSTGKFANKFVTMAEQLTGRNDLALLTTLPWQEIVPAIGTGLMAQHTKWCSCCLADYRNNHPPTYFKLSWGYALYQVCSVHHLQLVDECPWCGRHQPFIPVHASLGRCNYCYGWLGTCVEAQTNISDPYQLWISGAIEDMIIHGKSAMQQITGELFRERLVKLTIALADNKKRRLSEMLGFTPSTMASWITKKQKPLFPQFLYLCYQLGVLPSEWLLENFDSHNINIYFKSHAKKLHCISPKIGLQEPPKHEIYARLQAICNDTDDCRPMTAIITELALSRKYLHYWFKKECEVISLKHKQWINRTAIKRKKAQLLEVRNITWRLYDQGLYPSNRQVAKQILPLKLCFAKMHLRTTHRNTLKELGLL
jgi:Zn-finger protein/AraC-like DNA-binding protein